VSLDLPEARARAARLAEAIDELRAGQERLLELADRRERAIRAARPAELADSLRVETETIRTIAETDAKRAQEAAWFAERLGGTEGRRARATWIASRLPASMASERQRIEQSAASLREAIERVARRTATDRLSAERLARHMRGLIETASERLGASGGYGSRGERAASRPAPVGIDVTS
jgi:hypothetical protein